MVAFKIVEWLRDTADFYLHDPASEKIFMPYGSKLAVWQLYESQAKIGRMIKFMFLLQLFSSRVENK